MVVDNQDKLLITTNPPDVELTAQTLQAGFCLSDITVLPEKGFVVVNGEYRHLSAKAFEVLLQLALHAEEIVPQQQILLAVWADADAPKANLTHAISEIRHVLGDHKECPVFIQTLPRRGYRLLTPLQSQPTPSVANAPPLIERRSQTVVVNRHWSWLMSLFRGSRLFSVSVAFLVSVWLFIQVMAITFPLMNISATGMKLTLLVLLVGFPVVLLITWVGDLRERKRRMALSNNPKQRQFWRRQLAVDLGFLLLSFTAVWLLGRSIKLAIDDDVQQAPAIVQQTVALGPIANSLAILPFQLQHGSKLADYLLSGIRDELVYSLTQLNQFPVLADRAMQNISTDLSYQQLADQLRVEYVLEGRMQIVDEQFQLAISLVETATGMQRWSTRLAQPEQALPTLQRDLHRQVQNALVLVMPQVSVSLTGRDYQITNNFKAFDAYMQAQQQLKKYDDLASLDTAEQLLLQALKEDADFALASASLCKVHLDKYALTRHIEEFDLANTACQHAAGLAVNQAEVYSALGELYRLRGQYPEAIAQYEQALAVNSRWVDAITGKARVLSAKEQSQEAELLFNQAIELEPGYWQNYMHYGRFLYDNANFAAAARRFEQASRLKPGSTDVLNSLAAAWFLSGQFQQAITVWQQVVELSPVSLSFSNLGTALYFAGDYLQAEQFYRQALAVSPADYTIWTNLADVLDVQADRQQEALGLYQRALSLAQGNLVINAQAQPLLSQISRLQAELQQCEQAFDTEQQLLVSNLTDFYVFYDLAIANFTCQRALQGITYLQQAIDFGYPASLVAADPKIPHEISSRRSGNAVSINQHEGIYR
nr:tetratricopeptide repeat protein [Alishewanella maricola]